MNFQHTNSLPRKLYDTYLIDLSIGTIANKFHQFKDTRRILRGENKQANIKDLKRLRDAGKWLQIDTLLH